MLKKKSKDPAVVWDGKPSSISEQNEMWQNFQSEIDSLFDKSGSPSSLSSKSKSTMETKDIQQKLQREDYKGRNDGSLSRMSQDTLIEGASGCYGYTSCGVIGNQIIDTGNGDFTEVKTINPVIQPVVVCLQMNYCHSLV